MVLREKFASAPVAQVGAGRRKVTAPAVPKVRTYTDMYANVHVHTYIH